MSTRKEIVSSFYDQIDEDGRLNSTRHGQLEYYITMTYMKQMKSTVRLIRQFGLQNPEE